MNGRDVEFRWPPSGYGRLLGASAAGRHMHPPFVGSAASGCEEMENGRDFPSLVASDANENSAKIGAASATSSITRRVHFADEGVPHRILSDAVPTRHSRPFGHDRPSNIRNGIVKESRGTKPASTPSKMKTTPFGAARSGRPIFKKCCKWENPSWGENTIKSASVTKSEPIVFGRNIAPRFTTFTKDAGSLGPCRKIAFTSEENVGNCGITEIDRTRKSAPKVHMNIAAVIRRKHILQRLRDEWNRECGGAKKPCPFGEP